MELSSVRLRSQFFLFTNEIPNAFVYPWKLQSRNWFKGADTTSLLAFLEPTILSHVESLENDVAPFFQDMHDCICAANQFMRCVYHAALWLTDAERDYLLEAGYRCINKFHKLASKSFELGLTRFKYQPKFHMYGELLYGLSYEKRGRLPSLNPLTFCTQQDEDFVGRIATFSRSVSVRTVHLRTLNRYQIALAAKWWNRILFITLIPSVPKAAPAVLSAVAWHSPKKNKLWT